MSTKPLFGNLSNSNNSSNNTKTNKNLEFPNACFSGQNPFAAATRSQNVDGFAGVPTSGSLAKTMKPLVPRVDDEKKKIYDEKGTFTNKYITISGESRPVFVGPRGGHFYRTSGGNQQYIGEEGMNRLFSKLPSGSSSNLGEHKFMLGSFVPSSSHFLNGNLPSMMVEPTDRKDTFTKSSMTTNTASRSFAPAPAPPLSSSVPNKEEQGIERSSRRSESKREENKIRCSNDDTSARQSDSPDRVLTSTAIEHTSDALQVEPPEWLSMRPNGVAHLFNDTFLINTSMCMRSPVNAVLHGSDTATGQDSRPKRSSQQESPNHVFLCTSSFEPAERVTAVPLERATAFHSYTPFLPNAPPSRCFHSFHASPDGGVVAVVSQNGVLRERHAPDCGSKANNAALVHYLLVLSEGIPVQVYEWRCPSQGAIISVCWHVTPSTDKATQRDDPCDDMESDARSTGGHGSISQRRLLVLTETGELFSFDTTVARLAVSFLKPKRVDCCRLLKEWIRNEQERNKNKNVDDNHNVADSSENNDTAAALGNANGEQLSKTETDKDKEYNGESAFTSSSALRAEPKPLSAHPRRTTKDGSIEWTFTGDKSAPPGVPPCSVRPPAKSLQRHQSIRLNSFGIPIRGVSLHSVGGASLSSAHAVQASHSLNDVRGGGQSDQGGRLLPTRSDTNGERVAFGSANATAQQGAPPSPTNEPKEVEKGAATDNDDGEKEDQCDSESPHMDDEMNESVGTTEEELAESELFVVDVSLVPATRSLPTIVLLLTRSGDVFSVRADRDGLPQINQACEEDDVCTGLNSPLPRKAGGAAVLQLIKGEGGPEGHGMKEYGGRAHGCSAAEERDQQQAKKKGDKENEGERPPPPPPGVTTSSAVAVRGLLLDEDTGLHVILIAHQTGTLTGTLVDEPQLLARHRVNQDVEGGVSSAIPLHRSAVPLSLRSTPNWYIQLGPTVVYTLPPPSSAAALQSAPLRMTTVAKKVPIQFDVVHQTCLIRYEDRSAYLVGLPKWNVRRGGWSYWDPGDTIANASERQLESDRWSLVSTAPEAPLPISLRLPFDLLGMNVSLGAREVLLAPSLISHDFMANNGDFSENPSLQVFSLEVSSMLRGALYASAGRMRLSFSDPQEKQQQQEEGCVRHGTVDSTVIMNDNKRTVNNTTTATPSSYGSLLLDRILEGLTEAHRSLFAGEAHSIISSKTVQVIQDIERMVDQQEEQEQEIDKREAALRQRLSDLSQLSDNAVRTVKQWRSTVLDAIAHQRGEASFRTANQRLGAIHSMLDSYEQQLDHLLHP